MGYNHAKAEKEFWEMWNEKQKICREAEMSEENIQKLFETEREIFNSDRRFYEHNPLSLNDTQAERIDYDRLEKCWMELIPDENAYRKVMELPEIVRKAYFLNKIRGYSHEEISVILHKPRRTISFWVGKITEILK